MLIIKWIKEKINDKKKFNNTIERLQEAGWWVSYH